ncbi:cytochrome P450 2U1-like [Saccoglossus kowalevskii]
MLLGAKQPSRTAGQHSLSVPARTNAAQRVQCLHRAHLRELDRSIHKEPTIWPDPDKFDPMRFYDEKNNAVKKSENFMPFSAGRRVCMGEQLAKHELFLYFSAMINQFKFSLPVGAKKPSTDGVLGLTLVPEPYQVVIRERNA